MYNIFIKANFNKFTVPFEIIKIFMTMDFVAGVTEAYVSNVQGLSV